MTATHLEFLVEEPSMEVFLHEILPGLVGEDATYMIHVHQGKADLLKKLPARLRGYSNWLPETARIIVLVDQDADDCRELKARLERDAAQARLTTRSSAAGSTWQVLNRIAIEELEAWFFGNWPAVRKAYPKVSGTVVNHARYRYCDAVAGGTWEAFERVMRRAGYFSGGLRKGEAAREIGRVFDPSACISASFIVFRDALVEAVSQT